MFFSAEFHPQRKSYTKQSSSKHVPSKSRSPWFWVWSFLQLPGFPHASAEKCFFHVPIFLVRRVRVPHATLEARPGHHQEIRQAKCHIEIPPNNKSPQVQGLQTFLSPNKKYTKYRPNCRIWEGWKVQYTKDLMLYHTQCILGLILEMDTISRVNHHCGSKSGDPMNGVRGHGQIWINSGSQQNWHPRMVGTNGKIFPKWWWKMVICTV